MKKYFIIGTDTNCGKTYVTCQLVNYLKQHRHDVLALKPVASGCIEPCDDVWHLKQACGSYEYDICPWKFAAPISPHLAAAAIGKTLHADEIANFCNAKQFKSKDYLLIEGAGGLMAPLNEDETWIDVLIKSRIPVILVVGMRLGCLNHAMLTMEMLKMHNIVCAGWVANCIDKNMQFMDENIQTLRHKFSPPLLTTIAYEGAIDFMDKNLLFIAR